MKAINRFPHFFNASMHADITEDQTGKKKPNIYICILCFAPLPDI